MRACHPASKETGGFLPELLSPTRRLKRRARWLCGSRQGFASDGAKAAPGVIPGQYRNAAADRSFTRQHQLTERVLNMAKGEQTGAKAGKAASKVLKDGRTGKDSKTAAGSALTQRPGKNGTSKKK